MADIKTIIEEVMTEAHKKSELIQMNMAEYKPADAPANSKLGKRKNYKEPKFTFKPIASFKLTTESAQNQLEEMYYWVLDFMQGASGFKVEKIVDNFTSSPGSGHFAEMGQRATRMQEEGMKIFGAINQVVRSALNLVYDLKEFKTRLAHYDDYHNSKDKHTKEAGFLALKQIWLDAVDLPKRQQGSIHQLTAGSAQGGAYTTLREAFMFAQNLEDIDKMGKDPDGAVNEAVTRLLKPRFKEFLDWIKYSETELRKRYNIERSYLKSQVETLKLYNSWLKPYITAAEQLRQEGFDDNAALVNAFSTSLFQLTLLGTKKETSSRKRDYIRVAVVNFDFRAHLLQRATQRGDYAPQFGGLITMQGDCYSLNNEELELIRKKFNDDNLKETLEFQNYATDAIKELQEELNEFLEEKEKKPETKKKKEENYDNINPFTVIFGMFKKNEASKKKKGEPITDAKQIKKDNWTEKQLRAKTAKAAVDKLLLIYDIYKKSHGQQAFPTLSSQEFDFPDPTQESTKFTDSFSRDWK